MGERGGYGGGGGDPTVTEFDEEDALELEDEGEMAGVPPAYAISARRLGMSPEEIHSHNLYHRSGPTGASV